MAASAYLSDAIITTYFAGTKYVSEHTGPPGATGANEVTTGADANYARQSATLVKSSIGSLFKASNSADVVFPAAAAGSSYTVTHLGIWDAATAGNLLATLEVSGVGISVTDGKINTFAIGEIVVTGE